MNDLNKVQLISTLAAILHFYTVAGNRIPLTEEQLDTIDQQLNLLITEIGEVEYESAVQSDMDELTLKLFDDLLALSQSVEFLN